MSSTVYVVHCVDTEGPLFESLDATFERISNVFDVDMEPSRERLEAIQAGEVDLGDAQEGIEKMVDPELLDYNETWDQIDEVLEEAMGDEFRNEFPDAEGKGWIYNWFCVDHVGYEVNPRRRDIGYHNVFDHYQRILDRGDGHPDRIHFHYHPHHFRSHAHRSATHWWANSDTLYQVLCRRIIDRGWFPAANRPGFHTTRPDSHWFTEQFIPFDYANQAMDRSDWDTSQKDQFRGIQGDWRRAPVTWEPYQPAHDDYQTPGDCRRWIARCLNVGTRHHVLTEAEVERAFREASEGKPVVLSFTDHDHRDIRRNVREVREMLRRVSSRFPDVEFVYADAVRAMREALDLTPREPCELDLSLEVDEDEAVLTVESTVPTFGPQPFLAIRTVTGDYFHDNLVIDEPRHRWSYVFNRGSLPIEQIETVGVAANNEYGTTTVATVDPRTGEDSRTVWNHPKATR